LAKYVPGRQVSDEYFGEPKLRDYRVPSIAHAPEAGYLARIFAARMALELKIGDMVW
jgi:hypothetical protein